jgi:SnoaL-like protein
MEIRARFSNRSVMGCSLLICGFVVGCLASQWIVISPKVSTQHGYAIEKGDAPASVRAEVLESLREFQAGYSRRDPKQLDDFMQHLFPKDQDTRVIGTDLREWINGYQSIARFIRSDWLDWGNLHLAVDDSVIDSSADVAWLATTGTLVTTRSSRSIRYAAVLTRREGRWLFRQIQFQWDERPVTLSDLTKWDGLSQIHVR